MEHGDTGKYYYEYSNLKKRTDQLEIFFHNFSIFTKNIFQKEIKDFDHSIFLQLQDLYNNMEKEYSKNFISLKDHHKILNQLNIKVNELRDINTSLLYIYNYFKVVH